MSRALELRSTTGVVHSMSEPTVAWPRWATWALIAVILTSILTIYATVNDIY